MCEQYEYYREQEIKNVEKVMNNIGVDIKDKNGYLPVHEVMIHIAKRLKDIRETHDPKDYEIIRESILLALLGHRYRYELQI